MAIVPGVCVVEITVLVQEPQQSTFPADEASQIAQPTTVADPAVIGAVVKAFPFVFDPDAAALMSAAATEILAYPVAPVASTIVEPVLESVGIVVHKARNTGAVIVGVVGSPKIPSSTLFSQKSESEPI